MARGGEAHGALDVGADRVGKPGRGLQEARVGFGQSRTARLEHVQQVLPGHLKQANRAVVGEGRQQTTLCDLAFIDVAEYSEGVVEGDVARRSGCLCGAEDGICHQVAEVRLAKPGRLRAVVGEADEVNLGGADDLACRLGNLGVKLVYEGCDLAVLAVPRAHELACDAGGHRACRGGAGGKVDLQA